MTTVNRKEFSCRSKLILPPILPWESGTNNFASQKGEPQFGAFRKNVPVHDELLKPSGTAPVPPNNNPLPSFGEHRPQIATVTVGEGPTCKRIPLHKMCNILSQANPSCSKATALPETKTNDSGKSQQPQLFRPLTEKEAISCKAAIPRFMDPRNTTASKYRDELAGIKQRQHRSTWSQDFDVLNSPERQRYLAWSAGQITTIKPFVPVKAPSGLSLYQTLMFERECSAKALTRKLEEISRDRSNDSALGTEDSSIDS